MNSVNENKENENINDNNNQCNMMIPAMVLLGAAGLGIGAGIICGKITHCVIKKANDPALKQGCEKQVYKIKNDFKYAFGKKVKVNIDNEKVAAIVE